MRRTAAAVAGGNASGAPAASRPSETGFAPSTSASGGIADPTSVSVYQNIARGAPATDNFPTRNGSINFGAADSYNTERFEFHPTRGTRTIRLPRSAYGRRAIP